MILTKAFEFIVEYPGQLLLMFKFWTEDIEASPPAPLRKKERGDNDVKIIGVGVIY